MADEEFTYDEEALCNAETLALKDICHVLGLRPGTDGFVSVFPGRADCVVFDIGHLHIGDQTAFPARHFCFRGNLDLYNRSRPMLQRWLSRLMAAFPVSPWNGRRAALEGPSNVQILRIAPENGAVSQISSVDVTLQPQGQMAVHTAQVDFDVVFTISPPESDGGQTTEE
jgi:hypothetical protein